MAEARVKAGLWVGAALRLAQTTGRYGAVLRRGDADSGGILVVLRAPQGLSVLSQMRTAEGEPAWLRATGPGAATQATVDAYVERQVRIDPDLWVVEFEGADLTPPFEAHIIV